MVCVSLCSVYHTEVGGILAMRGRTEDSVGSQAGEHLLAWPWEGSIILVGWEGVWSHFIWGKVVSGTVALFSALGTDGLKASILVIETLRRLVKN